MNKPKTPDINKFYMTNSSEQAGSIAIAYAIVYLADIIWEVSNESDRKLRWKGAFAPLRKVI